MYTLIHNGTLIDGTGSPPKSGGSVLIKDGVIEAVGPGLSAPAGQEVTKIDAQGGYILPGLIDTHVHLALQVDSIQKMVSTPFSLNFYKAARYMQNTINAGITSVRDAGGADLGMKQAVEQGYITGPRMQISITVLSITGGHGDGWYPSGANVDFFPEYTGSPSGICDGVDGVRKKVREVLRAGAEVIKICSTGGVMSPTDHPDFTQFSMDELKAIVEEADNRNGIKVMSHAQGAKGIKNAVRAGVHSIEHGIYLDDEAIDLMLERGTYLVPTLLAPLSVIEIGEATGIIPPHALNKAREVFEDHRASIARAHECGVKIAMGTDAGVMPHGTNLRELHLMAEIGMSPMEVIVATTKTAAECLGWEKRVGTLEAGKLGDVIVTAVDPLKDLKGLANNDNIKVVIKGGTILKDIRSA